MTSALRHSRPRRLLFALTLLAMPLIHAGPGSIVRAQTPASEAATSTPATENWIDAQGDVDVPAILQSLDPDVRAYIAHITTLANPFFEGRSPDTRGNRIAAEYIEFWFKYFGLKPAFPEYDSEGNVIGDADTWVSYRQPFDMPGGMEATRQELALADDSGAKTTYAAGRDFNALGVGQGEVEAPLTFVGYGIASGPNEQDHYGDIDLTGRIALVLRFEPSDEQGNSKWTGGKAEWSANASVETKMLEAARRGAAGIILVNPPGTFDSRTNELMTAEESTWRRTGVPVVQMSIPAAERLVKQVAGKSLLELKHEADDDGFKASNLDDRFTVSIATTLDRKRNWTDNVGGVIRGRGDLANEWIIIGAHYDHVGYGNFGSMAGRTGEGIIHPGADDNGSGTSAVLVLADRLSKAYAELPADASARSVLLMTFSAEESGLNGSRYYTRHPTLTAEQVNIMLNLDMVGRLRDNSLEVSGIGSATQLAEIVKPYFDRSGLRIVSQQTGSGPSDHASFNAVGIPVLFFFTGLHPQYHRPADVASLINPVGAIKVVDLAEQIAMEFASRPEKLEYQQTRGGFRLDALDQPPGAEAQAEPEPAAQPMPRVTVRLGIQPEYNAEGTGVHLAGVSDDTPAQAAGLQAGDVILSWNGSPVADIRALMTELAKHKPGDEVNLGVKRGEETLQIKVKLAASDG